jgi:hypothetical protein
MVPGSDSYPNFVPRKRRNLAKEVIVGCWGSEEEPRSSVGLFGLVGVKWELTTEGHLSSATTPGRETLDKRLYTR